MKKPTEDLKNVFKISIIYNLIKELPQKLIEITAVVSVVAIFYIGSLLLIDREGIFSLLILFATFSYRLMPSFNKILSSIIEIKNKSYTIDIMLKDEDYFENKVYTKSIVNFEFDKILFENISFKYNAKDKDVLSELNFSIEKGQIIGVMGESGSGKTTLIKILLGLLKPNSGKIILNEKNIINENLFELLRISYVKQDFFLLDSSIRENIVFGRDTKNINQGKLKKSAEIADILDKINSLEKKEHASVGEFGKHFSGGQRQRIAIARALYNSSDILIFDEATSNLDEKTERKILSNIRSNNKNTSIVMITHNKSTLEYCDIIIEIKEGKAKKLNLK